MPASEIARRVGGVSERLVRYRIERLEAEGLIEVSAVVSPKMLGYDITADVWLQVELGRVMEIARQMAEYDCTSYVACSIGETDVSLQVVGRTTDEVYRFITEVIGKIPGVIKTTTSIVPLVLKDTHHWSIPESACMDSEERPIEKKS